MEFEKITKRYYFRFFFRKHRRILKSTNQRNHEDDYFKMLKICFENRRHLRRTTKKYGITSSNKTSPKMKLVNFRY